jgi:hypothetical protein
MNSRLSKRDKYMAVERLRRNMTGIENKHFRPRQMLEAFTDLRAIMLALLFTIGSEVNGATGNYEATLIKGQVKFSDIIFIQIENLHRNPTDSDTPLSRVPCYL